MAQQSALTVIFWLMNKSIDVLCIDILRMKFPLYFSVLSWWLIWRTWFAKICSVIQNLLKNWFQDFRRLCAVDAEEWSELLFKSIFLNIQPILLKYTGMWSSGGGSNRKYPIRGPHYLISVKFTIIGDIV